MRSVAITLLALTVSLAPVRAQEASSTGDGPAGELVELLQLEQMNVSTRKLMIQSFLGQSPEVAQLRDIFEEFFDEYMSWDVLKPEYIRLYRESYTDDELRQLVAFYRTPVGQKTVAITPRLMEQGAEIGRRTIEPHLPELQRRIQARLGGGGGGG